VGRASETSGADAFHDAFDIFCFLLLRMPVKSFMIKVVHATPVLLAWAFVKKRDETMG
jgi:hypothetical protein